MSLHMPVDDIFRIGGKGAVLTGSIELGQVYVGKIVRLETPSRQIEVCVNGLEVDRQFVSRAREGQAVGLLFDDFDLGLEKAEDGSYDVSGLVITEGHNPWWKFW